MSSVWRWIAGIIIGLGIVTMIVSLRVDRVDNWDRRDPYLHNAQTAPARTDWTMR